MFAAVLEDWAGILSRSGMAVDVARGAGAAQGQHWSVQHSLTRAYETSSWVQVRKSPCSRPAAAVPLSCVREAMALTEDAHELLKRAAARLDRMLARATPGRWLVDGPWDHGGGEQTGMVTTGADRGSVVIGVPSLGSERSADDDLTYMATMGPPVARALARWRAGYRPPHVSPIPARGRSPSPRRSSPPTARSYEVQAPPYVDVAFVSAGRRRSRSSATSLRCR